MNIKDFMTSDSEQPLDRLVDDGGFTGIFRTVACVGDSLSSGEFVATNDDGKLTYHDYFEYSWGQYIARAAGCTVYNFSKGGMTAERYCTKFAEEKGYWNPELAAQAYILALGVNDVCNGRKSVGSVDDICLEDWSKNADTFAGWYGRIIQRYKEIQPEAKFFLMTMPYDTHAKWIAPGDAHANLLRELVNFFPNTYLIDLRRYAPVYDDVFQKNFYLGNHMNPAGYMLTAKMVMSYIDYIIRNNHEDFAQVGFIGKSLSYDKSKLK